MCPRADRQQGAAEGLAMRLDKPPGAVPVHRGKLSVRRGKRRACRAVDKEEREESGAWDKQIEKSKDLWEELAVCRRNDSTAR